VGVIRVKRIYDAAADEDGMRILVDRIWPRGVSRAVARIDQWPKETAPSHELRRWFSHESERWTEFKRRYFSELDRSPDAWAPLIQECRNGTVTLLYAASDRSQNNAVALCEYLSANLGLRAESKGS